MFQRNFVASDKIQTRNFLVHQKSFQRGFVALGENQTRNFVAQHKLCFNATSSLRLGSELVVLARARVRVRARVRIPYQIPRLLRHRSDTNLPQNPLQIRHKSSTDPPQICYRSATDPVQPVRNNLLYTTGD